MRISDKASRIVQAEIRSMSIECERVNGINLAQGVCDTAVPSIVMEGASKGIIEGENSYTRYDGTDRLRVAIAGKLERYNRVTANPKTEIIVSAGSTGAFYCACLALLNPGDEVILFEPYYGYHLNTLLSVDAVATYVKMEPPDWTFRAEDIERVITPRTKAIMVNTPGNPSGKVFTRAELLSIAEIANRHDLFVFTDEIYEYILYDNRTHLSPAAVPELAERCVTISGYSKTFSITGWRIGYCVCHERWAKMIGYLNDLVYVCAPAPLQAGVAAGIEELPVSFYDDLRSEYTAKRDLICDALKTAGLRPAVPQGAYYVLADVSSVPGKTSKEKAMRLLSETGVASVPGEAFYHDASGENLVRFCFAKEHASLIMACERLGSFSLSGRV